MKYKRSAFCDINIGKDGLQGMKGVGAEIVPAGE
jgi:hypothetical protein